MMVEEVAIVAAMLFLNMGGNEYPDLFGWGGSGAKPPN